MGEARRRRGSGSGDFVRLFEAGERDMVLGEIMARGAALLGARACLYVLTNKRERMRDPLTGQTVFPKRFIVARYLTHADRERPEPQRQQQVLGDGASWAEAFARAESALRAGGHPLVS